MLFQVSESPSSARNGLLTRDLPDGTTRWYDGVERDVALVNETQDIILADTTCSDAGVYMCHLAAPVGEQNQDGYIHLVLAGKNLSQLSLRSLGVNIRASQTFPSSHRHPWLKFDSGGTSKHESTVIFWASALQNHHSLAQGIECGNHLSTTWFGKHQEH